MSIPFIDLKTQYARIEDLVKQGLHAVLEHGRYVMGPEIVELEEKLAAYSHARYGVGCASGTDALTMALLSLGVGPGDAVFTTPFTFMATAETVALLGATPVFVDIDPVSFNLDPDQLKKTIARTIEERPDLTPRGVISVDIFGQPADYDRIEPIAGNYGLFLLVDAAQSFGAVYKGRPVCSLGDIATTSFFPAKPLGCYGDGGMCFTDDDDLLELLRSVRVHGMSSDKYDNVRLGITGRLDSMQAAVLLAKFTLFSEELELRQKAADRYEALLADIPGVVAPHIPHDLVSSWAQYSILAESTGHREELMGRMAKAGVPTAIYYPKPLHLQTAYEYLQYQPGSMPVSESVGSRIFSLPMHPYLSAEDQETVVRAMK